MTASKIDLSLYRYSLLFMTTLKQAIARIPFWAYLVVLVSMFVNTVYFVFTYAAIVVYSESPVTPVFSWAVYLTTILFGTGSLYLLYKKPGDRPVRIFFFYVQFFVIMINAGNLFVLNPLINIVNIVFHTTCFIGSVLISFHLVFPKTVKYYNTLRSVSWIIYVFTTIVVSCYSASYIYSVYNELTPDSFFFVAERIALWWLTLTYIGALAIAVYQYATLKDTLLKNQVFIVCIGSLFGLITPMCLALFYDFILPLTFKNPNPIVISQGICSLITICCILTAIFRYRIWDIEVVIRKALLYLGATAIIILSYLFLVWLIDQFTAGATDLIRFAALGISVILFLVLRDRIQRLIDRIFHRETYDSATVVSDFEAKLAGIYRFDELKQKIVQSLDEIFHFKSFVFNLKKNNQIYEPAYALGIDDTDIPAEYEISAEIEDRLRKSKVFSPQELNVTSPVLETIKGDLIVPMVSEGQPEGFFICGQKKSERIYSRQDINVLSLLARRVVAMLHTASLYQKDLDRQLMLERERARIAQDMHDDIGAGLTKIAMISEAPVQVPGQQSLTANLLSDRLKKIATSSRDMISRLNVIVWALNPRYDNLESLVSYLRRYFGEYLENFGIQFSTGFLEEVPERAITPDTRRNIFYIIQEAIHNAVKHSGCTEIGLDIAFYSGSPHNSTGFKLQSPLETNDCTSLPRHNTNDLMPPLHHTTGDSLTLQPPRPEGEGKKEKRRYTLTFIIIDNGKGFDQVKTGSGGNGLLNMKKRAEELSGTCEVQSSPGKGTKITVRVNI